MIISKSYLKQIIKEEIKSINQITFDVDKTFMHSGNMPYVEITLNFPNTELAEQYKKTIQDKFKTLTWTLDDNTLYTQVFFRNMSMGERYSYLEHKLKNMKNVFDSLGIKTGKITKPLSNDEDYPSKPTLKIVK